MKEIEFTGEFMIPGKSGHRIEQDHISRYEFAGYHAAGRSVLDIACGYGYGAPIMLRAGARCYTGIDINHDLITNARSQHSDPKITYEVGDIRKYKPSKEGFDLVLCFETIEHIPFYKEAIRNLYRMLSSDGLLIISSPNRPVTSPGSKNITDKPLNKFHTQEFTIKELSDALKNEGFIILKDGLFGQRLSWFYTKNQLITRIRNRLIGNPMVYSNSYPKKIILKQPAYFIILAKKLDS